MTTHERLHTAILNTYRSGGDPLALASEFSITQTEVTNIIRDIVTDEDRAVRHKRHGADQLRKWTDTAIIEAVRSASPDTTTPPTKPQSESAYKRSLSTTNPMPSFSTVINRFKRWNYALDAAGFVIAEATLKVHHGPQTKWTDSELLDTAIKHAILNGGRLPSINEYTARKEPQEPSAILLRNRFNGWSQLRLEVSRALGDDN